jgi:hypothetical protein
MSKIVAPAVQIGIYLFKLINGGDILNTLKTILTAMLLCLLFGCQNNFSPNGDSLPIPKESVMNEIDKIELMKVRQEKAALEAELKELQAKAEGSDQEKLQSEIVQLRLDNASLIKELKLLLSTEEEKLRMDLRSTINLSFKIFSAMQSRDYNYLISVSAPNLKIDKKENKIIYDYGGKPVEYPFLRSLDFNSLEYWSHSYLEQKDGFERFQVGFAHFWNENGGGHAAFYMSFSKINGEWLLDEIIS